MAISSTSEIRLDRRRCCMSASLRWDLKAVLVVDNVACGPAIGGLRMAPDVSVEECVRLARAMTLKNSAAGLAHGGGKSVLWGDPRMPRERKEKLIRAFAHALRQRAGLHRRP